MTTEDVAQSFNLQQPPSTAVKGTRTKDGRRSEAQPSLCSAVTAATEILPLFSCHLPHKGPKAGVWILSPRTLISSHPAQSRLGLQSHLLCSLHNSGFQKNDFHRNWRNELFSGGEAPFKLICIHRIESAQQKAIFF